MKLDMSSNMDVTLLMILHGKSILPANIYLRSYFMYKYPLGE